MNFAGKFDAKLPADVPGSLSHAHVHVETLSASAGHAPSDAIIVPDVQLLFNGDFKRSGLDLILSKDDHELVLQDYFKGEKRAALSSPDGAHLTGDIVNALTGHVQYAQADGSASAGKVIGHVTKLVGTATAIRNGVSIILNNGDNVEKGDVVQAGSDSMLGITFIDGTVFALSSNARMVLNDMVYDANGSNNSSLLSLVAGTISFVAGETAKHGDMKVTTPVATMGIRGTAVLVEIGFEIPVTDPNTGTQSSIPVKFQVLQEPNGTVGSYVLYAKNDLTYSNPIATISRAGEVTSYSANGNLSVAQVTQLAPEAKAIIDAALGQYFPNYTPSANPQGTTPNGSTPPNPVVPPPSPPEKVPLNPTGTPTPAPINYNAPNPANPDVPIVKTVDVIITPLNTPPTFNVTPVVNVITPVVADPIIRIPDQVTGTDPDPNDVVVKYVPGSGRIVSAVGPAYAPAGVDLKSLVLLNQATGDVTYNSPSFAFLKADDQVVVTVSFDVSSGPDTIHQFLTVTIVGVNDAPTITAATLTVSQGGTVLVTASNIGVIDPDNTDLTFAVSNVSSGDKFQVLDGSTWVDATTFTTADLAAGHARFVQGGSFTAPTFSIQANDGSVLHNLSNVFTGVVNFVPVAGAILGDDSNNILVGTPGNDVFEGFGGNDQLQGGGGRDKALYADATAGITVHLAAGTVHGTAADDLASIGTDTLQSIEYIVGSNFDDTFDATGFSNTSNNAGSVPTAGRFSGSITNFFEGLGGDDHIIGNGATQIAYDHASAGVTVDLAAGTGHGTALGDVAGVGNDDFSGVTGVRGSAFADRLSGNDDQKGVDVFYGGAGDDCIDGRAGYDLVVYKPLVDNTVTGGITVDMAAGTVLGDSSVGNDTLRSIEAIRGTDFNDNYNAAGFGSSGANVGSLGAFNQFEGMGGNDVITGNNLTTVEYTNTLAGVTVDIAAGNAHSTAAGDAAGIGVDTFSGVNGVRGSEYEDFLYGSNNPLGTAENFTGGGGDDTIDGRGGFDRAIYSSTIADRGAGGITVNLALGTVVGIDALGIAAVGSDILKSIEGVRGTNFNDIYNAAGFGGASTNAGSFGTFNEFEGMDGDDFISGNGNTKVAFYNALAGVTVNLATGSARDSADYAAGTTLDLAGIGKDTITLGTVNAVAGSAFADSITGDDAANILTGGGGNDAIDGGAGTDLAVFSGAMANYSISFSAGQIQVTDAAAGRDGTDTLSNVEALQFTDGTVLVASGTSVSPIDLAALTQGIPLNSVTTRTGGANDFVRVNSAMNGLLIDLGAGTGDTVLLGSPGSYSLNLADVEKVGGTSGDDTVTLQKNADGLAVDLGAGNNTIYLAGGSNTLSAVNVQNINGTDFSGAAPSNDTLTLLNNVSGVSINLAQGANTLNLAAGSNTLANAFGVQTIKGTASGDSLTLANAFNMPTLANTFNITVDLAEGVDTLTVTSGAGLFPTLKLVGVEYLAGTSDDNYITLMDKVDGLNVDLGQGNDTLMLANGINSVSVTNVETISASDFPGGPASSDTLTLLNNVTGVSVDLKGGTNTLNLHAGINSLAGVFNVQSIHGSASSDTLTLGEANGTTIDLGAGNDTLNLGPATSGVTFVYADNGGADVVSGFNQGDKIDLTGIAGVHSLADLNVTQYGADTVINFGNGNSLTLTGVTATGLVAQDFVFAPNHAPTLANVDKTINDTAYADTFGTVTGALIGHDSDVGQTLSYAAIDGTGDAVNTGIAGVYGTLTVNSNGSYNYVPNATAINAAPAGAFSDTFSIVTSDGMATTEATLTVHVNGVNDTPVANDDTLALSTPAGGGWSFNSANGHFYRLVASNVSWTEANDDAQSDGAYLATITSQAEQDFVHALTDGVGGWLGGYSSDASQVATWQWVTGPETGAHFVYQNWNFGEPSGWEYDPPEGLHLQGSGGWNDVPTTPDWHGGYVEEWGGRPSDANVGEDSTLTIATSTLLANDADADSSDHPTIVSVSATSADGALVTVSGTTISYDPTHAVALQALKAGETTTDTFTYTIDDGHGGTDTATVTLVVAGINDAPDFTGEDRASIYVASGAEVALVDDVSASDIDSINYAGGSLTATVTDGFHVGDALSIANDGVISVASGGIVMFDADGYGGEAAVLIGTRSVGGTSLTVTLNANADDAAIKALTEAIRFETWDSTEVDRTVTFTLNDGDGIANGGDASTSFDATVHFVPTSPNQAPLAVDDTNSGHEDTTVTGTVASNDSDVDDGETATLIYMQTSAVAGLTINEDGSYSFDAGDAAYQHLAAGVTMDVVASYTVTDVHGAYSTGSLTITLTGTNDAPVAVDGSNSGYEDTTITGTVASDDSDVDDGETATLTYAQTGAVAGLTINSDGSYSFDAGDAAYQYLAAGATMDVVASYTVTDIHGADSTGSLTITLTGVNDPPTGSVTISGTAQENQVLTASNMLADADGLGAISYQWQRDGIDIGGATGTTYTLGNADVGHTIDVVAHYTDGHGTLESVASAATAAVTNVNDAPTGSVTISGTVQ
ncbi:VCBS domain-containing protein, partial [Bradyrhizobium sp. URHD0069]|uniref:VCBS domain-containing protein n=1 Tax=Bradyrhizobium sp. URHD0069 TaxID=1380355 RepID=UPI000565E93D